MMEEIRTDERHLHVGYGKNEKPERCQRVENMHEAAWLTAQLRLRLLQLGWAFWGEMFVSGMI